MDADLVLEGGGVKGIGLEQAALCDAGHTFHRIAGASAGAIVGALIAAGIKPDELEAVMRTVDHNAAAAPQPSGAADDGQATPS
jgi:NTE family protein